MGLMSADNYEKVGYRVKALDDLKIFPLYGVWIPTHKRLYKLLLDYIKQTPNILVGNKNIIDLGTGTGILSFILAKRGKECKIYGIDKLYEAMRCTRLNS